MAIKLFRILVLVFICNLFLQPLSAQQKCQPPALKTGNEPNIFTEIQEVELGDIIAEQSLTELKTIEDQELTSYLKRIGERLLKHAPETKLRYQFAVMDIDDANAYSFPGGRIYVSRKLIALMKSEDELASIIAHEIGHLVGRDSSEDMTWLFREVIGVTQVGDRKDIFEKLNKLIENAGLKTDAFRKRKKHDGEQEIDADTVGFYLLVSAGYKPQAMQEAFDRITENKGKKGSWVSDLFGTTAIESKRFREMSKKAETIPQDCIEHLKPEQAADFTRWQTAVVNFTERRTKKESLHNVISKHILEPSLQSDITNLKFSPDGKYILAQDSAGITVLTRQPFQILFRIDAYNVDKAQFTADSESVVFSNDSLRIENWSIAEKKLKEARELYFQGNCLKKLLSPDSKILACLDDGFNLKLFEVATNIILLDKKDFYEPSYVESLEAILSYLLDDSGGFSDAISLNMNFTPDSKIFAAGHGTVDYNYTGFRGAYGVSYVLTSQKQTDTIAFDIPSRKAIQLSDKMKKILSGGFAFLSSDKVIGIDRFESANAGIISFPKGDVITKLEFPTRSISLPTKGNYVLVKGMKGNPLGISDISSNKLVKGYWREVFDIYDDVFVAERKVGDLALYKFSDNSVIASLVPPKTRLGSLDAVAVSDDFSTIALSQGTRGAVWDLSKNQRIFVLRGFNGAYLSDEGSLYADFPQDLTTARTMGVIDLKKKMVVEGTALAGYRLRQHGQFLVRYFFMRNENEKLSGYKIEVQDTRTQNMLWSKQLRKDYGRLWVNSEANTMVLQWGLKTNYAKEEIKKDPALNQQLVQMREKEGDYFLQVLDAKSGNQIGRLFIETGKGSFRIGRVFAIGNWVIVGDTQNRILVYSLTDGQLKGRIFGDKVTVAKDTKLLCVENRAGQLEIYDLNTLQKRDELQFTNRISLAKFSKDGKKLFVLTADQEAFVIDVSGLSSSQ